MAARVKVTRKKLHQIKLPQSGGVYVGFPVGTAQGIIERATWNEFGTRRIPERPFMRRSLKGNRAKYQAFMRQQAKQIIENKQTVGRSLSMLGIMAQGDIQHEISVLRDPPNAPSTIARKGSSKPLIDTGQMRQSVTYRVQIKW